MAKWREKSNPAKTSVKALIPWRTTIEHNPDGSINTIETHYSDVNTFEDGLTLANNLGSICISVSSLTGQDKAHADNINRAVDKLIGDRLPS